MEQQTQQPIQEKAETKPPIKTNWKYIAIVAIASSVIAIILLWYFLAYVIKPFMLRDQYLGDPHEAQFLEQQRIQSEAQKEFDTSTWQTYRSEEFGFELRSPATLPVFVSAEYDTQTIISIKNSDIFGIFVNKNSTSAKTIQALKGTWGELVDEGEWIDFAGVRAFELETGNKGGFSKILVFEHPQNDLVFIVEVAEAFFEEGLPDQILSTFRFSP